MEANNISFEETASALRAQDGMNVTRKRFANLRLDKWVSGINSDTGDILFFLPVETLNSFGDQKDAYLDDLRENWRAAHFQILEESEIPADTYKQLPFSAVFFRLRSLKDSD